MPTVHAVPDLAPALPEIILAVVAMALLMLGVFRGDGSTRTVSWLAVAGDGGRGVFVITGPSDGRRHLLGHVRRRPVRRLHEGAGADRVGTGPRHVVRIPPGRRHGAVRVPGPSGSRHSRYAHDGLGERSHGALSGTRAPEPRALRGRGLQARVPAQYGGRVEVLRARGPVVGHVALWLLADLRDNGRHRLRRPPPPR